MKKTICAHTLVKNEDCFLWFSVKSVIDYVDQLLLWDTGSEDNTLQIIKSLVAEYPDKISFREIGQVNADIFTSIRQEMLQLTNSDWLLIVDGDEIWWKDSIRKTIDLINQKGNDLDTIVNPYINLVGDIYHHQNEMAGNYQIDDKKGFVTIRAINRQIPGLKVEKPHGQQGFFDKGGVLVQNLNPLRRVYLEAPYLHFTHLKRSSLKNDNTIKRNLKYKYELGNKFPPNFKYPESLYLKRPDFVSDPWTKMSSSYLLKATLVTPLRKIKRHVFKSRVGY